MAAKPAVFIGSSTEGVDIANAISTHLSHISRATPWTGIFGLSRTGIENLEKRIAKVDFGVVVLHARPFPAPARKPCVRFSRTRLLDVVHRRRSVSPGWATHIAEGFHRLRAAFP